MKEHFILTAHYLKYYNKRDELLVGYDPGHFSSLVVAQEKDYGRELRAIKEFYCCYPDEQPELARQFSVMQAPTLIIREDDGFTAYPGVSDIRGWLNKQATA